MNHAPTPSPSESDASLSLSSLLLPFKTIRAFQSAFRLQKKVVSDFYRRAALFSEPDCPVGGIPNGMLELKRNVFSTLFLGVTLRLSEQGKYVPLYGMVNQCMRSWVTACDNLLDDEYKVIFDFPEAGGGERMRSVLTLMVAERVLSGYVMDQYNDRELLQTVERLSLSGLLSSAMQECEEEGEEIAILPPDLILSQIHQRKTADLFLAPLLLPEALERPGETLMKDARGALGNFALGCQLIDDVKDMNDDFYGRRHNYLVSLLSQKRGNASLDELRLGGCREWTAWERFPEITRLALAGSRRYFGTSFEHMGALGILIPEKQRETIFQLICRLLRIPQVPGESTRA